MPLVTISIWEGRDRETKRTLIKKTTEAVAISIGCPKDAVHVIINEVPKENWGIAGKDCTEMKG